METAMSAILQETRMLLQARMTVVLDLLGKKKVAYEKLTVTYEKQILYHLEQSVPDLSLATVQWLHENFPDFKIPMQRQYLFFGPMVVAASSVQSLRDMLRRYLQENVEEATCEWTTLHASYEGEQQGIKRSKELLQQEYTRITTSLGQIERLLQGEFAKLPVEAQRAGEQAAEQYLASVRQKPPAGEDPSTGFPSGLLWSWLIGQQLLIQSSGVQEALLTTSGQEQDRDGSTLAIMTAPPSETGADAGRDSGPTADPGVSQPESENGGGGNYDSSPSPSTSSE
jgi:hypothetical protein